MFCAACDPAHLVKLEVRQVGVPTAEVPAVVALVAQRHSLESRVDEETKQVMFSRGWASVETGHPRSIMLTTEKSEMPVLWRVQILEWLVFKQTGFGKELQQDLTTQLQSDGYVVVAQ